MGAENFELLAGMAKLQELKFPVLAGVSRKGFLGEAVKDVQAEGLPMQEARKVASVAGNVAAVLAGAHILRVHDLQAGAGGGGGGGRDCVRREQGLGNREQESGFG